MDGAVAAAQNDTSLQPNAAGRSQHRRGRYRSRGGGSSSTEHSARPLLDVAPDTNLGASAGADAQSRTRRGRGGRPPRPPRSFDNTLDNADQQSLAPLQTGQHHTSESSTANSVSNPRQRHRPPRPPRSANAPNRSEASSWQPGNGGTAVTRDDGRVNEDSGSRRENNNRNRNRRRPPADRPPSTSLDAQPLEYDAQHHTDTSTNTTHSNVNNSNQPKPQRSRRAAFNSRLTESQPAPPAADADLTTRLIHAFSNRSSGSSDALECPICFVSIHPAQPTWSCAPSPESGSSCCWTTFHLKCIKEWAGKSTKETREAYRARNEDREGEWRCPGCQTKRHEVPRTYRCFCGRAIDPKLGRATPHSCGESCSRSRDCQHPCPLPCHPGPCPTCTLLIQKPCHCGRQVLHLRCSHLSPAAMTPETLSCHQVCGKSLGCGKHTCEMECHEGECRVCEVTEQVRCYCGKERDDVPCGKGIEKFCEVLGETGNKEMWRGRFECGNVCDKTFACGIHRCQKTCHPPSLTPDICPFDPTKVSTCPCGKKSVSALSAEPRTSCTAPIPTCKSTCARPLSTCAHACAVPCHTGPCPPCTISISVACRCGDTLRYFPCSEMQERQARGEAVLCERQCPGLRHCGKHKCNRVCCPLAQLAKGVAKGKRRAVDVSALEAEEDPEGWHVCDLLCNKRLTCGLHYCTEKDHRGPCPPCLQSSFDELICNCGRTVLMPPIPCGTKIQCNYLCTRPPPACGHPKAPHACHEDGACPPCVVLTEKQCACGKETVNHIQCWQEKVSCGKSCGKLLDCGFHSCDRLCHADACGSCAQVCGKPRKLCKHGCKQPCHAPSACPENEPCGEVMTQTCACGRISQPTTCGACTSNPSPRSSQKLDCAQACLMAKRNASLAEALGISPDSSRNLSTVTYPDELITFFRANSAFCITVERALNEFAVSDKKSQVLPHMPPQRRKFVHDLATVYRMTSQDVDQEPHRSVQLVRRIDTRIPPRLLSASIPAPPSRPLGGLADLKKAAAPNAWGSSQRASSAASSKAPTPVPTPAPRPSGPTTWSSIASRSKDGTSTEVVPSRWDD
ncbi:hypothetical protein BOTBODRAFT_188850 [Botryobasidium botryosum FD-172 SS1]|uniref:R3H domain-containing protein n=1 Tax=Botryobasidium botryosum (strain FD-172 SS1) TaxID=930990 RepID=A0A067MBG1_BOTB1|nr:hypothetical protein BOTBODRAFT_188850 [Botryobasidium botryosum FD-172 SS1]